MAIAGLLVAITALVALDLVDPDAERDTPGFSAAATGPAPAAYSDAPSSEVFKSIDQRSADSRPLTKSEVFPRATRTLRDDEADVTLELRDSKVDGDCAAAAWGLSLATELRRAGCAQAVRGIYSDDKQRYAATVAVLNLSGVEQANAVVKRLNPEVATGFVLPLPGEAPLNRFGQGFSVARGRALGHYVLVSWVQRLDGQGDADDKALLSLVVTGGKVDAAILGRAVS